MSTFYAYITALFTDLRVVARSAVRFDGDTIKLCGELIVVSRSLDDLLSSKRDTDEIEEYETISREQARLIECISRKRASTISGLLAKAECALLKPIERGYDSGVVIGLSVCRDILLLRS